MNLRLLATILTASLATAQAKVVYVNPGGTGTGSSWQSPLGTVQAGVNAASTGDEVWIAAGMYTENLTLKAGVSLYGGFNGSEATRDQQNPATNVSILDGLQKGPVITVASGAGNETVIDSLTIQDGKEAIVNQADDIEGGAAVYAPAGAPTVTNCIVQGCGPFPLGLGSLHAGVIYSTGAAVIEYNTIQNNAGAAIGVTGGTVIGNTIANNSGGAGISGAHLAQGNNLTNNLGGITADTIRNNVVMGSLVFNGSPRTVIGGLGAGGALVSGNWISGCTNRGVAGSTQVTGNWIIGNTDFNQFGAGVFMHATSGRIVDNLIANNGPNGAGIYLQPSSAQSCTVLNNTIVGNFRDMSRSDPLHYNGAAIAEAGSTNDVIVNNIIAFNALGISTRSATTLSPMLRNNDFYGNTEGNYVNFPDVTGTNGNISADPQFVDYTHGNYHLQSTSPCINTGDDSVVMAGDTDLEQAPRIVGPHVDMGAYESLSSLPFTFSQAVTAIRILGGLQAALPSDLQRLNIVASDTSVNRLDIRDAARLVRKAAGLDANP